MLTVWGWEIHYTSFFLPLSPSHYFSTVVLFLNLFLLLGSLNLSAINLIANSTRIHFQLAEANHWRSGSKFNDGIRYLPFSEDEIILRKENRSGKSFDYKSLFYTEKNAGNSATFYILFRHIYLLTLFKLVCLFYLCILLFS